MSRYKKTEYVMITLQKGEDIFVRKSDFLALKRGLGRQKKPTEIVKKTLALLMNSPEGMNKLHKSIECAWFIAELGRKKAYDELRSMRDLIDFQLNKERIEKNLRKKERRVRRS